jgi:hypothetical protein
MEKVPLDFALGVALGVLIPGWIRFRREKLPHLIPLIRLSRLRTVVGCRTLSFLEGAGLEFTARRAEDAKSELGNASAAPIQRGSRRDPNPPPAVPGTPLKTAGGPGTQTAPITTYPGSAQ